MGNIKKYDNLLYKAIYGESNIEEYNELWNLVRKNTGLIKEAIKVEKDKFGKCDVNVAPVICECMLIDYMNVDKKIYNEFIKLIYSNIDIARTVLNGASNGGSSFLLMSLWNHNLKLTNIEKQFALEEAMNKVGIKKDELQKFSFKQKLNENIKPVILENNKCIIVSNEEARMLYARNFLSSTLTAQNHGIGCFDIRYWILKNPNWSLEEKKKLVYDFWVNNEQYNEALDEWERAIINDKANIRYNSVSQIDIDDLYEYTYEDLLDLYMDEDTAKRIYDEIKFCQMMHEIRPKDVKIYKLK